MYHVTDSALADGHFTHKSIGLRRDALPQWTHKLIPINAVTIHSRCTDTFPLVQTEYTVAAPMLEQNVDMSVTAAAVDNDRAGEYNACGLSAAELAKRQIVNVDVTDVHIESSPPLSTMRSALAPERFPLSRQWRATVVPVCTVYIVIRVDVRMWMIASAAEHFIMSSLASIQTTLAATAVATIDEWSNMTQADIRQMERRNSTQMRSRM